MLGSLGGVEDLDVLDLFCGSGALGIEALSRGAGSVTFVDSEQRSLDAAKANVAAVGLGDLQARFVRAALPAWVVPSADVVLADPPYDMTDLCGLLERLDAQIVVLETAQEPEVPDCWVVHRQRRYGTTLVTVLLALRERESDS